MASPVTLVALSAVLSLLVSLGTGTNVLFSGETLETGKSLSYKDRVTGKQYTMTMQTDCNLVVSNGTNQIWSTNTRGWGINCYLKFLSNGELIIYRNIGFLPVWRSKKTSVEGNYALVLRYDGSLRVYGPTVWSIPDSSSTVEEQLDSSLSWPATTESVLFTEDIAPIGTTIANGDYALVLQDSCNLVLTNTRTGEILCETNTADPLHDCYVTLDSTGQLKMGYMGGEPFWVHGGVSDYGDYVLVLHANGKLVIYGPSIWSSDQPGLVASAMRRAVRSDGFGPGEVKIGFTCENEKLPAASDAMDSRGDKIAMVTAE